jgi:uncharacterized protein (TIGR03086 family)
MNMTQLDLSPATDRIAALVATIDDEQLDDPTPLPAYRVRHLLDHIGTLAQAFVCAARKERNELTSQQPTDPSRPLPDDWRTAIPRDLGLLAAAWADPLAWEGETRIAGMDSPAESVGLVVTDELVVHGWDLARAIGADYDAEPDLIAGAKQFLGMVVSDDMPAGDRVAFGPPRPLPSDASPLEEVLALCGRDVGWTR